MIRYRGTLFAMRFPMHTDHSHRVRASRVPAAALPGEPAPFTRPAPPAPALVAVPALPGEPVAVEGGWEVAARQGDVVRVASAPTAEEARALLLALLGLP